MSVLKSARACLGQVKAYQPGKPLEELEREYGIKNAVKMASNENALGPSARVLRAIRANLGAIHRYPDGGCHALRGRLSRHLGVKPAQLIFGNGSDEVLVFAVRAFVERSDEVIVADPSFLIYEIASQVEGARVVKVPAVDFRYDLDAMARRITSKTKLIFIANPDNPIGTYVNAGQLKNFLKKVPEHIAVVVDEAYYEFARSHKDYPDSLKLLRSFSNLIITRTFSKVYGMGGLRIGYAIAREPVITVLQKVREPFNINSLAQAAAVAALEDTDYVNRSLRLVEHGRRQLKTGFERLGCTCVDTATNFMLVDVGRDERIVYEKLLRKGVIVRPMTAWGLARYLRVTIGRPAENRRLLAALQSIFKDMDKANLSGNRTEIGRHS